MNNKLICVAGPTASGKTALAVFLAKALDGEVVSADSMQIYQKMNIGTAKPSVKEQEGIPHHLIDILSPFDSFSVKEYAVLAQKTIGEIQERGKLPILAGGTGLFINTVIDQISFNPSQTDEDLRQELQEIANKQGNEVLHAMLREIDPESADRLHPNNLKRIIRAIELYRTTGITMTQQINASRKEPSPYDLLYIGLNGDRKRLYDRINHRVDVMLSQGLLEEISTLKEMGLTRTHQSIQGIGYKELFAYLEGETTLLEAVEKIKQESRRYAKRQLTWFRRDSRIHWIDIDCYSTPEEQFTYLKEEGII